MKHLITRIVSTTGAAVLLGALAACGSDDAPAASPSSDADNDAAADHDHEDSHEDAHDDASHEEQMAQREEVDEPRPRLVVSTDSGVIVLDAAHGDVLGSFETEIQPRMTVAGDRRHVYLAQADADLTQVLDAGAWAGGHGDHYHYYVQEPAIRDIAIEGDAPVHVVPHNGVTAIFHDDAGAATVFDEKGLLINELDTSVVDSGSPHHGVVVPLRDSSIVSLPPAADADTTLPTGVAIVDESGEQIYTFDTCPELHGEAAASDATVFGCTDGLLVVHDGEGKKLDYPTADGIARSFTPGPADHVLVGDYTETSLLAVDVDDMTTQEIMLNEEYAARHMTEHGDAVVLTTDGALHVIDPSSGEAEDSAPGVLPAFEIPEDWREPRPTITVAGHTAYVADPAQSVIVPVDLEDLTTGDPISLDTVPTGIVSVGEPPHTH